MARAAFVTLEGRADSNRPRCAPVRVGTAVRRARAARTIRRERLLLKTLARESRVGAVDANEATAMRCHRRFISAVARLQQAGLAVTDDVEAGAEEYAWLRTDWDARAVRIGDFLGYPPDQIDVGTLKGSFMPARRREPLASDSRRNYRSRPGSECATGS